MRKIAALLLLPLLFFVAACENDDTAAPSVKVPSTDEKFIEVVRGEISFPNGTDSKLIQMGHTACEAIDNGATVRDFTAVAMDNDLDPHDFGFFIGASINAYCPEHRDFLNY